jgi:hypothetical protein
MAFPFFERSDLSEQTKLLKLDSYRPTIAMPGLLPGVDNVRHDVVLSPRFCELARTHISRLVERHGNVEDVAREDSLTRASAPAFARAITPTRAEPAKPFDAAAEFKRQLADMQTNVLKIARARQTPVLDLLLRLSLAKFLRNELFSQYNNVLERCRAKLRGYELSRPGKGLSMRERFQMFQLQKRTVCRRVAQDLLTTQAEVEAERVSSMRRSLFGEQDDPAYKLFLNRLIYTEDGQDDMMNAEFYVMLGNFSRDIDRFDVLQQTISEFVIRLGLTEQVEEAEAMLNVPANAAELVGEQRQDESPKGRAQRAVLTAWLETLEEGELLERIIAAYESVPLLPDYCPTINPQQLKNSLISRTERKKVEMLLESQGRLSPEKLYQAARRVAGYGRVDHEKFAIRFLRDFLHYHRDRSRLAALNSAFDLVHLVANERLRELSRINGTLYEFLLSEEQKPLEERVTAHVVLKADIRDSTELTRSLQERGLNPASYFSLNFYEPVNKLLPKYNATKVFIEGDAVILATFEREGETQFGVARTSMLATEIIEIVRAYNKRSTEAGLPVLELGIGICYQDAAPMYLMDGETRIMISRALNESDRLSSCSKRARRFLADRKSLLNVFRVQTGNDEDASAVSEEFALSYNVGGIHLNEAAFRKLQQEVALGSCVLRLPTPFGVEEVKLYRGVVPIADGLFRRILVREALTAQVHARDFKFSRWTDHRYFEVCVSAELESMVDEELGSAQTKRVAKGLA